MKIHRAIAVAAVVMLTTGSARAEERCDAPISTWQPRSAVKQLAEQNGWHIRRIRTDDGCYEVRGRDADGQEFHAEIDPATLAIIDFKLGHGRRHGDRHEDSEDRK